MTSINNAAALERLEQKWRESVDMAEAQRDKDGIRLNHAAAAYHNGLATAYGRCADELAILRQTITQPDALTSEPSGMPAAWRYRYAGALVWTFSHVKPASPPPGNPDRKIIEPLFTHPSADAPGQPSGEAVGFDTDQWIKSIVDDGMIDIAIEAYNTNCEGGQRAWMRSALIAALKGVNND